MNKFVTIISTLLIVQVWSLGSTLTDCQAVAALFDNTCTNDEAIVLSSHPGKIVSCMGDMRCPEGNSYKTFNATTGACKWTRKLCVTCWENEYDNHVWIRYQSNTLPNHCFESKEYSPEAHEIDIAM